MAKIQLKKSAILDGANALEPTNSQMLFGELAVNYNADDPCIFFKDSDESIIRIAGKNAIGNRAIDIEGYPTLTDGLGAELDDRYLKLNSTGTQVIGTTGLTEFSGGIKVADSDTHLLELSEGGSSKVVVTNDGKMGVGTSTPTNVLQVVGTVAATTATISSNLTAAQIISTVADGTAPLSVTSTTTVNNLNADTVDGLHALSFLRSDIDNVVANKFTFSDEITTSSDIKLNTNSKLIFGSDELDMYVSSDGAFNIDKATGSIKLGKNGTATIVINPGSNIIKPNNNNTGNIGSSTKRWNSGHFTNFDSTGTITANIIDATTITGAVNASNLTGTIDTARLPATYTLAEEITIEATGSLGYLVLNADKNIGLTTSGSNSFVRFQGNNGQGSYRFTKAGQSTIEGLLDFESLTSDRTFTYPDISGTIALTTSTIDNADKVDNLHATSFVRSDADASKTGNLILNTATNTKHLYIGRTASTVNEYTKIGRDDTATIFYTKNDESSSRVVFQFENTDTEGANVGANASNRTIKLISNQTNASITVEDNLVWHEGNDGAGSSLDADLLDGQHGSYYTNYTDTAISDLIDSSPGTLNTLNELASALGDDANFSTTITNSLATKLPLAGGAMTGNITFSGTETVDGRDLSVDGSKLDGIETGATADQTATEILNLLKTVDTNGSGLNADKLDGQQGSYYQAASTAVNTSTTFGGDVVGTYNALAVVNDSHTHDTRYFTETEADARFLGITAKAADSDKLDNLSSGSFLRSDADGTYTGTITGNTLLLGGSQIISSVAKLQVNGFMRTGNINIHQGGNSPNSNYKVLSNNGGVLEWDGDTVWTSSNNGAGSLLNADQVDGYEAADLLKSSENDSFSGNLTGSGTIYTTGNLMGIKGDGGGVCFTTNDGGGNANVAFNHEGRVPDQSGSSGRINCSVDSNTAALYFQLKDSVTAGTTVGLSTILTLTTSSFTAFGNTVWHAGNDGALSTLDADLLDGQHGSYYTGYTDTAIANLIASSPSSLNTLNELAAALGDDANFSTTITDSIGLKLPKTGGTMSGNIVFTGSQTVDGRDLSADGSKLDGIEAGATADLTATEILNLLKTVDTDTSGLNADTLDGIQASNLLKSNENDTFEGDTLTFSSNVPDPVILIKGTGPNFITFASDGSGTVDSDSINLVYRTTANTLGFERTSDETTLFSVDADTARATFGENIVVAGTVDGRDLAIDGTKLDGIEAGATADLTATEILNLLKTVDTDTSGLNAATLDGQEGSYYTNRVTATQLTSANDLNSLTDEGWYKWATGTSEPSNSPGDYGIMWMVSDSSRPQQMVQTYGGTSNKVRLFGRRQTNGTWDTVWTEYWSDRNDGDASGLDADLLDGQEGSYYQNATNLTSGTIPDARITDIGDSQARIITFDNLEKSDLTADGQLSFDSSQGLIVYRQQQGVTEAVTVWDGANVSAGTGISITNLDGGDTGTGAHSISLANHSAALLTSGTIDDARIPDSITPLTRVTTAEVLGSSSNLTISATGSGKDLYLKGSDNVFIEPGRDEDGSVYFRGNSGDDSYRFAKSGQTAIEGFLSMQSLTADRTFTFPDVGGTIALTSSSITGNATTSTSSQSSNRLSARADGSSTVNVQGMYTQWNRATGTGSSYFINQKGGGGGGWRFLSTTTSNVDTAVLLIEEDGRVTIQGSDKTVVADTFTGTASGNLPLTGGTLTGDLELDSGAKFTNNVDDAYDKIRVWNNNLFTIGMKSSQTHGDLNDYAMTFTMNDDSNRGWLWRDVSHDASGGAMSLTTRGSLAVSRGINIGGGETDTNWTDNPLYVDNSWQTGQDASYMCARIDADWSGAASHTVDGVTNTGFSGNRTQTGIRVDVDNSKTNTTNVNGNRHTINAIHSTADCTEYTHDNRGLYSVAKSTGAGDGLGTQSVVGAYTYAQGHLTSGAANIYGLFSLAYRGGSTSGGTLYAVYGRARSTTNGSGKSGNAVGGYFEIECEEDTIGDARAVMAHIDHNGGTITTGYLFHGSYAGTVGTKWGTYITGETKNYLSGELGIGTTAPAAKLDVNGNIHGTKLAVGTASNPKTNLDICLGADDDTGFSCPSDGNLKFWCNNNEVASWTNSELTFAENTTVNGRLSVRGHLDLSDGENLDFGDDDDVRISYNSNNWLYTNFRTSNGIVFQDNGVDTTILEDSGIFRPQVSGTGSLGTDTSFWGASYFTTATLSGSNSQLLIHNPDDETVIHRNDGGTYYILLSAAGANPSGTWSTLRPFLINLQTGKLSSENSQEFFGGTSITNSALVVESDIGNSITLSTKVGNGNDSTFIIQKSRGGNAGPSQITAGDSLGQILWKGYDADSYNDAASITCVSTSNTGDFNANLNVNVGGSTSTFSSGGFDVSGYIKSSSDVIEVGEGSGSVAMTINDGQGNANLTFNHAFGVPDVSGSSARIESAVDGTNARLIFELKDSVTANTSTTLTNIMTMDIGAVTVTGSISATADITAYSSDRRLKENFRSIEEPIDKIKKLNGYIFDWNDKSAEVGFNPRRKKDEVGLIAQEVQDVIPQAVAPAPFDSELNHEGTELISLSGENYLTVQYEKLVPLLIESIKEQQKQIDELRQEIKNIKGDK